MFLNKSPEVESGLIQQLELNYVAGKHVTDITGALPAFS